jgi:DNA-binding beta-propeller fold protein YncE
MNVGRRQSPVKGRTSGWWQAAAALGLLALAPGLVPSLARGPDKGDELPELAWPPDQPRVALERVIAGRSDLRRRGFWRRLAGQPDKALFQRPYGVAWDSEDLLVTDPAAGRVLRITRRGKVTSSPEGLLLGPIGVASCPDGVVVSDSRSGRVALLSRELELLGWLAEGLERPTGVGCTGQQILAVETGKHRVHVLGPGEARTHFGRRGEGPGEFNFPSALVVDHAELWVGDTLNFRLQQLSVDSGQVLAAFGQLGDSPGEMPRIKGLALDAQGNLWISDGHLDVVTIYSRSGRFLMDLGGTGSHPGEFSFPAGIAAGQDGRVAVVDSLNRRLQVFRLLSTGAPDEP